MEESARADAANAYMAGGDVGGRGVPDNSDRLNAAARSTTPRSPRISLTYADLTLVCVVLDGRR